MEANKAVNLLTIPPGMEVIPPPERGCGRGNPLKQGSDEVPRRASDPDLPQRRLQAGRWAQLSLHQAGHPLQVEGQTHQTPFPRRCFFVAQRELAKAQHFLHDPYHGLDCTFPQAVNRLPDGSLQLVGHFLFRRSLIRRWVGHPGEIRLPA